MTDAPTPEERAFEAQLVRFVKQLEPKQQVAVKLFYLDGYSYEEIAKITGYNLKTVKSHIQNGVRNLRVKCDTIGKGAGK
jgi:RNA polymerase sigma-70 factor (ECF subfamily)